MQSRMSEHDVMSTDSAVCHSIRYFSICWTYTASLAEIRAVSGWRVCILESQVCLREPLSYRRCRQTCLSETKRDCVWLTIWLSTWQACILVRCFKRHCLNSIPKLKNKNYPLEWTIAMVSCSSCWSIVLDREVTKIFENSILCPPCLVMWSRKELTVWATESSQGRTIWW